MWCAISCSVRKSHDSPGDFLYNDYTVFFEKKGISLLFIPNAVKEVESYFERFPLEGIILSGGNDLETEPLRDKKEAALMDIAIRRRLPVLGICRGMQFINFYFKGALPVELGTTFPEAIEHVAPAHTVRIMDPAWSGLIGRDKVRTNSFHRQGVKGDLVSPELEVLAVSEEDGVVEAVRHRKYPIAGVQWHPERQSPDSDVNDAIVESFKNKILYWSVK